MKFLTLDDELDITINDLSVKKVDYCMQKKYMNIFDTNTLELNKMRIGDKLEGGKILSLERFHHMVKDMPIFNNRVNQLAKPMSLNEDLVQFDYDSICLDDGCRTHWDLDYASVYSRYGNISLLSPYYRTAGVRWVQAIDDYIVVRFDIQTTLAWYVDGEDNATRYGDIYYNTKLEVVKAKLNGEDIFVQGKAPRKMFARLCVAGCKIDVRNIREIYAKECE